MRSVRAGVSAVAILALAGVARAEVRNYVVADSGGGATCAAKRDPDGYLPTVDPGQLTVTVEFPNGTTPAATDVVVSVAGANLTPTITGDAAKAVVAAGDYKAGLKVKIDAIFKTKTLHCGAFETSPAPPAAGPASDLEAQRFLSSDKGKAELEKVQGTAGKSILLPHLPSGRAAFPYPASVVENDKLQAVLVADLTVPTGAILNMDSCPDREPFRILGDFSALAAKKQALEAQGAPPERFAVVALGAAFECGAGKMVYTAAQAAPAGGGQPVAPPATTLRVRPIYHLAATFIYAFDFQNQSTFSVKDKKVASQDDKVGPSLNVGFTWFPGGVDYEHMKGRNYWLNPFLVFDLKAPKENLASGLALTVSGGLSVAVGVSFHKSTILDGKSVGDAFSGDGTVPTRKVWDSKSVGFFVGVALDSAVFGKVKGLWGATSHS